MITQDHTHSVTVRQGDLASLPAWILTAAISLLAPWRLLPYHELRHYGAAGALLTLGVVVAASYGAVRLWRARGGDRAIVAGLGLLVLPLVPALPLLPRAGSLLSERFLYLPSAGLAIVAGAAVAAVPWGGAGRRRVSRALFGLAALLAVAGAWTFLRVGDWKDDRTLFSRALARDPDNKMLLYLLAVQRLKAGEPAEARPLLERAHALDPGRADVRLALANCLRMLNDSVGAARIYRELIADRVLLDEAWFNLGSIEFAAGSDDLGEREFLEALRLNPSGVEVYVNLGEIAFQKNDVKGATALWERGLSLDPLRPELLNNLGVAAMTLEDFPRARRYFERALLADPNLGAVRRNLDSLPPAAP
jgi:tetratricopeptide (TPR) repeat protein